MSSIIPQSSTACQSPVEAMIQIPGDALATLLSSIESLRKDVSTLHGQLSTLDQAHRTVSAQLLTLQKNTGVAFPLFSKLPPELRTMIWRYALTSIPQIHILGESLCSRSIVNTVAQSCKEALDTFERLQLDNIYIEIAPVRSNPEDGVYRSYINADIDTFWLNNTREAHIPFTVDFQCGRCGPAPCPHFGYDYPIHTMAINSSSWKDPCLMNGWENEGHDSIHADGTLEVLERCKVQELLIVVGDIPFLTPDTVFVSPNTNYAIDFDHEILNATSLPGNTWCSLEKNISTAMQRFKDYRVIDRKKACEEDGITLEELDKEDNEYLRDFSNWKIPTVRFVEAKPRSRQWVIPPSHS